MKAVILAAGRSERLMPFTETRAKPMIRVAGRTIMDCLISSLRTAGIRDIFIVVNHQRETLQNTFEHGHGHGVSIDYIIQDPIDGIGAGLRRCEKHLEDEPFLLIYGDVLTTGRPIEEVMARYQESKGAVAALTLPQSSSEFGNVYLDPAMRITRLVEKPSDPHLSNYVFAGIFCLPAGIFKILDQFDNDMEKGFQALIKEEGFYGTLWEGGWIDIHRPWQILEANRMLMDLWDRAEIDSSVKLEGNVHIEGAVHIEPDVTIAAGTILKGPCYVGKGSYIGNNALIRNYASLGPETVVGYGTELKNCVLFGRSILGRLSFIGDSVIGEGVHMGTGVTTVNFLENGQTIEFETDSGLVSTGMKKVGAFIGDKVVIGARNVLAPGTRIKAGSFIEDLITLRSKY